MPPLKIKCLLLGILLSGSIFANWCMDIFYETMQEVKVEQWALEDQKQSYWTKRKLLLTMLQELKKPRRVEEIVEFLKDPKKFSRLGGKIPKGAFNWPPGTSFIGKSYRGRSKRSVFLYFRFRLCWNVCGVGASRVRDMFEQGKTFPCIIFIDGPLGAEEQV